MGLVLNCMTVLGFCRLLQSLSRAFSRLYPGLQLSVLEANRLARCSSPEWDCTAENRNKTCKIEKNDDKIQPGKLEKF